MMLGLEDAERRILPNQSAFVRVRELPLDLPPELAKVMARPECSASCDRDRSMIIPE